jgi:long-chain acyl-CoA synthetase
MNDHATLESLTLPHRLLHWAATRPNAVALRQKDFGIWGPITWSEYASHAQSFGWGLTSLGLARGAHVAVLSENRKEWVFAQLGSAMANMVTVGLYPTSPASEIAYLLQACDAQAVVVEDQEQLDKVLEAKAGLPMLRCIVVIDPKGLRNYQVEGLIHFTELQKRGQQWALEHPPQKQAFEQALRDQSPDDVALMIFTSGSTGRPKAAMITYGNINAMTRGAQEVFQCTERDAILSYLPLCHVAEQMFTVDLPMASGAVVNFAESLRTIQSDLREVAPTVFLGVPRIWEKLHASITIKLREASGWRRALVERAMRSVDGFAHKPQNQWSLAQKLNYAFWWLVAFRALCNFLGMRKCRRALSGAAPISPELLRFYRLIGVEVTEGYGMTESAGVMTMQQGRESALGAVGQPITGLELRLAEDGELLARGPTIFKGYYRNEAATREAIDEQGWLHTGDVAQWVGQGDAAEIKIVDRKKDIMITAGGKNITPSEIENALKFSVYIKEVVVIGDKRHFVSALIQIDPDTVAKWAEEQGIAYTNFKSLAHCEPVKQLIQQEVDRVNQPMPQVQHIRRFHLLDKELDHDDGEVTATMKVRRASIAQKYAREIDALYGAA